MVMQQDKATKHVFISDLLGGRQQSQESIDRPPDARSDKCWVRHAWPGFWHEGREQPISRSVKRQRDGAASAIRVSLVSADNILEAKGTSKMVGLTAIQSYASGPNADPLPPVTKPPSASPKSVRSLPQSTANAPTDTAQISNAAQALLQEIMETQAQTVKEASSGDLQARRLQAKELATRKAQG